ncbi:DUF3558 domain-containing protein [Streptomyces sp. HNM0574]|uniref:DUF3558 domain-containing protein n=1 Tax=Streptomyces sp. HNM0574 TaxID=2714954 RepID=UPI001F0EC529|nr:DUF3558 domain-containing protein [Streptomyces sp. HNM0574]
MALPVLLMTACSSDSDSKESSASSPPASETQNTPSAAPVKHKDLPDACKTLSEKTVKDLTPGTDNAGGKRIGTGDTSDSGSCLWTGLDKYDYRQLTVSLKRFESDPSRGSGANLAKKYAAQQVEDLKSDKDNEGVKTTDAKGIGDEATSTGFKLDKKDDKGKSETFQEQRTIALSDNVVVVVDYEGAGFEDGDTPSADTLQEKAQKAAKEAVAALK